MKENYQKDIKSVTEELNTNEKTGLTTEEVKNRQEKYGSNELKQKPKKTILKMILEQLTDKMIIILLIASILSFVLGETLEGAVILFIIGINILISVIQEKKASDALEALKNMNAPHSLVLRNGKKEKVLAKDLVPGDIVYLEAGNIIPADIRWLEEHDILVDESALTGESVPVEKDRNYISKKEEPLGERRNMGFSSTIINNGTGIGVVTNIGMNTEIGTIAKLLDTDDNLETPLKQKLNKIGKVLSILGIIISILIFIIGLIHGQNLIDILMIAISLAISVIPEGLPATVTVVMAIGVQRMAEKRALVKQLPAVETLGSATVICTDKTGTLTENKMTVTEFYTADNLLENKDNKITDLLIYCGVLCNNASIIKEEIQGDPTEGALLQFAKKNKYNIEKIIKENTKEYEKPFDSDRKLMTVICKDEKNKKTAYIKGAPEELIKKCNYALINGKKQKLTEEDKKAITDKCDYLADHALRSLGFAYKTTKLTEKEVENDLIFLGITGMIDPPRKEVMASIKSCHEAGVRVIMITGDHKKTAVAIAKQLGIYSDSDLAVNVEEFHEMTREELLKKLPKISVFSRVSPKDKLDIVNALQEQHEIVGMTGDGVNDAPALNTADIGIAMGKNGTDVAKDAADMLLLDDNFSTIEVAIKEGRRIYRNIQKVIQFLLTGNIAEVLTILLAMVFNLQTPILAVHILFVNLITDTLPALALGVDPANKNTMKHPPTKKGTLFEKGMIFNIAYYGALLTLLSFTAYFVGLQQNYETAVTMTFITLCLSQIVHAMNQHSNTISFFSKEQPKNKMLFLAMLASVLILMVIIFVPALSKFFSIVTLSGTQWSIAIGLSFVPLIVSEIIKLFAPKEEK